MNTTAIIRNPLKLDLPLQALILLAIRALMLILLLQIIKHFFELDFSLGIGAAIVMLGVWLGSGAAFSGLKLRGLFSASLMLVVSAWLFFQLVYQLPLASQALFAIYSWHTWIQIIICILLIASFSTWAFWKYKTTPTIELILLTSVLLLIFVGHQNYRFDSSKTLNQIAWLMQWHPLATLSILGLLFGCFATSYLFFANLAIKSAPFNFAQPFALRTNLHSRENLLWSIASACVLSLLFIIITWFIYQQQTIILKTRLQMGVGDKSNEGLSPLTFESALGASAQPAAIVRLENDYPANPYSPMLYLREAALSKFNGTKMVQANSVFDPDVPNVIPGEAYRFEGFPEHVERMPLTQSIYLLTEHQKAFAVDYPLSLTQLTLPTNTKKFKRAYRAYSMVPTFNLQQIDNLQIGDSSWSAEEWQHFTEVHPDTRYTELAKELTKSSTNPIAQARMLIDYLNEKAIYTLRPGHTVPDTEDQTAPFLFGDLRGYCVHFAHAMVYMLRGLGIPARIGTGYLSDLSQSKDGHILLRMSDRHAWAEIYLTGKGWIPFDVEPMQVETHAESPVDVNLLEELMDLLGSSEEIIPEDILKNEPNLTTLPINSLVKPIYLYLLLCLALVAIYAYKYYLLFGYRLSSSAIKTARRAIVAVETNLADYGLQRNRAETLQEFTGRMQATGHLSSSNLASLIMSLKYKGPVPELDNSALVEQTNKILQPLHSVIWWRKIIKFLNPLSIYKK